jgi:ELWxxDGT repeat protein
MVLAVFLSLPMATRAATTPSMIKDICVGAEGSTPSYLTAVGTTLFFQAADAANGGELWKSDGTPSGTALVRDIHPGVEFSSPAFLTTVGKMLYFAADDGVNGIELWKSDGTEGGTVMVRNINSALAASSAPENLTASGNILYFAADDGVNGRELWKSDGTEDGTVMVKNIHAGANSSSPAHLTVMSTMLYFQATDQLNNHELWKSDGNEEGTVQVKDINPGTDLSSSPDNLTVMGGGLYFSADDGVHGGELWKSNGTETGTVMVKDIDDQPSLSSDPYELRVVGQTLYFFAFDDMVSYALWRSDGTEGGTVMVKDIEGTDYADSLTVTGSMLFFRASDGIHGYELWKSDGSASGTFMVKDINPAPDGDNGSYPSFLTTLGTTLYFSAYEPTNGMELWKSNGTASGTVLVKDINAGAEDSNPESLFAMGPALYFNATDGLNGVELWGVSPDDTPPSGTIVINGDRSATLSAQVTLALTWSDGTGSGVTRMRFSDNGATWSAWEALAATRTYTLPAGDGYKTVRVQYRDKAGNNSATFSDYIRLDTNPPTGTIVINGGAASTTNPVVNLSLTWSDGTGAGVTRMRFSDNGSTWTAWEPQKAGKKHTLPLPPGGNQTVRVQYLDGAGNVSIRYSDYIRLNAV